MATPESVSAGSAAAPEAGDAELRAELKRFIVEHLRIPDVDPDGLDDTAPLVESGLDLDSIDVLELVTGVEKKYGVRFEDPELVQKVFTSVRSIADHISAHRASS